MSIKKYLPSNILVFLKFVQDLINYAKANYTRWDISLQSVNALQAPVNLLKKAAEVSENPETRTSTAIKKRNEARAAVEAQLRPFIQGKLMHNPLVTEDDLTAMGLPVHDRKPTPVPTPDKEPEATADTPSPAVVTVNFRGKDEAGRAKPYGVQGAELRHIISDVPPTDWTELINSSFSTRSPFRLSFSGHERGKRLYYALRWENKRGEKGPWTEIFSVVIP